MDSVKPHDSGCYSDPGQHPTSAISLTTCNSSQICRVMNPASTTLYLLQLLPQHLPYATKSQISLNHLILPTQNALIIGEQPNPRKACNETAAPLRTGTQQATKSMNRDTLSRHSASSPAISGRAISNIDNVEDRSSRIVFEDASPTKLEKPVSAPFLSPQPLSRCPERRRRHLPATSPSLYSRLQPGSLNAYRILTPSPSEPLNPFSTPTIQP
jgi:hypothetical protein